MDGLLSVRSALDFVWENTNTSQTIVHGTSSGAIGGMSLIIDLGREGKKLDGAVLDSGVASVFYPKIAEWGCTSLGKVNGEMLFDRIGFFAENENLPQNAIASKEVLTPVFLVWNKGDDFMCGEKELSIILDSGETFSGKGMELGFLPIADAIQSYNPGNASVAMEVCVSSRKGNCDVHSPTKYASSEFGGDSLQNGESYNEVIMQWVEERLSE